MRPPETRLRPSGARSASGCKALFPSIVCAAHAAADTLTTPLPFSFCASVRFQSDWMDSRPIPYFTAQGAPTELRAAQREHCPGLAQQVECLAKWRMAIALGVQVELGLSKMCKQRGRAYTSESRAERQATLPPLHPTCPQLIPALQRRLRVTPLRLHLPTLPPSPLPRLAHCLSQNPFRAHLAGRSPSLTLLSLAYLPFFPAWGFALERPRPRRLYGRKRPQHRKDQMRLCFCRPYLQPTLQGQLRDWAVPPPRLPPISRF